MIVFAHAADASLLELGGILFQKAWLVDLHILECQRACLFLNKFSSLAIALSEDLTHSVVKLYIFFFVQFWTFFLFYGRIDILNSRKTEVSVD